MNTRATAAILVNQVVQKKRSLTALLSANKNNQSLIQELCYGTLRWYFKLKFIAEKLLHAPLRDKDHDIFCLILTGFYQLNYLNIPTHTIVNQTVGAAEILKKPWAKGLINKLLRRFIAEKDELFTFTEKTIEGQYAHPLWFIQHIKKAWPDHWESILIANNARPPMTLRVNLTKISREIYLEMLDQKNISAKPLDFLPAAIQLEKPCSVHQLPGFNEGYCYIQDAAGQFAAYLLKLENNQTVLDACAAPGSKTSHILEVNPHLKTLVAIDNNKQRLNRIKENITRLGLRQEHLQCLLADVSQIDQWSSGELFDRILLDAPCSATGVIRRHPDIKLLRQPGDISQYHQKKLQLLNALWAVLKSGGFLLYSTCSVLPDENEKVIEEFLSTHDKVELSPTNVHGGLQLKYGVQQLPGQDNKDGFYYSLLFKNP
ncbi:16S rRNA (cytosine(967)-C(5))-methyltransferase RsmB [Coxiella burnetii]|uniref:16S rRNA (cytosine(967)-C(5))-methyltransferase RsmB n=1 Tax=Coxiella burnetii TaxID=777 RepID=UPI000183CE21|nr:16S rRNA (cytosine(967)-C(5))-methyltransferase RsmB [Coxiella burnetii]ACJ17483.1 16S rRNA m(5)C 967 methyltransferase [Coxiella burnetii CbuG_Q212]ATN65963.1 16S rRNA methyltransferase [Coxiella burnetii]OYK87067.1 16S rRNA (cytosine(967)-C(5))-methyltransferase [Coxiella burnetii]